eukprot:c20003_g1_i1.p1 GENE.c20003_g1_i1~~c20003_g1_i1.p1  ORF type:complete len:477 (+),score=163.46 c20003_g1_i1:28-1458(+)
MTNLETEIRVVTNLCNKFCNAVNDDIDYERILRLQINIEETGMLKMMIKMISYDNWVGYCCGLRGMCWISWDNEKIVLLIWKNQNFIQNFTNKLISLTKDELLQSKKQRILIDTVSSLIVFAHSSWSVHQSIIENTFRLLVKIFRNPQTSIEFQYKCVYLFSYVSSNSQVRHLLTDIVEDITFISFNERNELNCIEASIATANIFGFVKHKQLQSQEKMSFILRYLKRAIHAYINDCYSGPQPFPNDLWRYIQAIANISRSEIGCMLLIREDSVSIILHLMDYIDKCDVRVVGYCMQILAKIEPRLSELHKVKLSQINYSLRSRDLDIDRLQQIIQNPQLHKPETYDKNEFQTFNFLISKLNFIDEHPDFANRINFNTLQNSNSQGVRVVEGRELRPKSESRNTLQTSKRIEAANPTAGLYDFQIDNGNEETEIKPEKRKPKRKSQKPKLHAIQKLTIEDVEKLLEDLELDQYTYV